MQHFEHTYRPEVSPQMDLALLNTHTHTSLYPASVFCPTTNVNQTFQDLGDGNKKNIACAFSKSSLQVHTPKPVHTLTHPIYF